MSTGYELALELSHPKRKRHILVLNSSTGSVSRRPLSAMNINGRTGTRRRLNAETSLLLVILNLPPPLLRWPTLFGSRERQIGGRGKLESASTLNLASFT